MNAFRADGQALGPDRVRPRVAYCNYRDVAAGDCWGPRVNPDLELILVVSGRFSYALGEHADRSAGVGQVMLIPPGTQHTVRVDVRGGAAAFSCIHCELRESGRWGQGDYHPDPSPPPITDTHLDPVIEGLFRRCATEYEGFGRHRKALLSVMVAEIWMRLSGHWNVERAPRLSRRMARMLDYLRDHLEQGAGRDALAQAFGITPQYVNALFRAELGISPGAFVRRERMLKAYRLLREQDMSVKETAAALGYEDVFHFSKVFKAVMGQAPSAVRAR